MREPGDYPRLTDKRYLEYPPYSSDSGGAPSGAVSGLMMRLGLTAMMRMVEQRVGSGLLSASTGPTMASKKAEEAAESALDDLVTQLNNRQPERGFHVTRDRLLSGKSTYSLETYMVAMALAAEIAGTPRFHFEGDFDFARSLGPGTQLLAMSRVYQTVWQRAARLMPHDIDLLEVESNGVVVRWLVADWERALMGDYFQHYAYMTCLAYQGMFASVPSSSYNLAPASIHERACVLDGHPFCEWEFVWDDPPPSGLVLLGASLLAGAAVLLLVVRVRATARRGFCQGLGVVIWYGQFAAPGIWKTSTRTAGTAPANVTGAPAGKSSGHRIFFGKVTPTSGRAAPTLRRLLINLLQLTTRMG
jgi:hypothetical protein